MDGVALRSEMIAALRAEAAYAGGGTACLATVVVGDNPRCHAFARDKRTAAADAGLATVSVDLPGTATQAEVDGAIARLAADPAVDGIFVQLPLPAHLGRHPLVPPAKDVDGIGPGSPHEPATALAIVRLLERYGVPITGRRAIAPAPIAGALARRGAHIVDQVEAADIVVATGDIDPDDIKAGAAVVDLTGGLVPGRAGAVAPYPTGVGPVAIACLLANTVAAHRLR